jgi:hypothetical protein
MAWVRITTVLVIKWDHGPMTTAAECPNPLLRPDARVLVGLLAILEAGVPTNQIDRSLIQQIRDRFTREGLLPDQAADTELQEAILALNWRVRQVLGELDS